MSPDPKAMARILRRELQAKNIDVPHSTCLEIVAKQSGFRDWNALAASLPSDATAASMNTLSPLPAGWETVGERKAMFEVGVRRTGGPDGAPCLVARARAGAAEGGDSGWVAIRQCISARRYIGRRISFGAVLSCDDVEDCAFLWLRVDNALGQKLAYVGRWEAPDETILTGNQPWSAHQVVLAVPDHAVTIEFGITLQGSTGSVMAAKLQFAETDAAVTALREITADEPANLGLVAD